MAVADRLGSSDCERLRDRRPYQPVNTLSSAAIAAAGAGILAAARRQRARPAWPAVAVGIGGVAAGMGSVDYHGWHSPAAGLLHDVGLTMPLLAVAATDAAVASGRRPGAEVLALSGLGTAAVGALLSRRPELSGAVTGVLAVALVPLEAVAWRERAATASARSRCYRRLTHATLATGLVLQSVSRTGGPLCRPLSRWQGHAGWHLAAALALVCWAAAAFSAPADGPGDDA